MSKRKDLLEKSRSNNYKWESLLAQAFENKKKEKKKIIKTEKFKTLSSHKSVGQELKK